MEVHALRILKGSGAPLGGTMPWEGMRWRCMCPEPSKVPQNHLEATSAMMMMRMTVSRLGCSTITALSCPAARSLRNDNGVLVDHPREYPGPETRRPPDRTDWHVVLGEATNDLPTVYANWAEEIGGDAIADVPAGPKSRTCH